ncbi:MAG: hypothetical protein ACREUQ_05590 [Burkholderiales bacterium]
MRLPATLICLLLLSACGRDANAPIVDKGDVASQPAEIPMGPPPPPVMPPPDMAPAFVDVVWRADTGSGVVIGTRYTFQSGGTLLVDSPGGTPASGAWRHADGALTLIEEGIEYPTDIVAQDAEHLHLRSHNPGGVVELVLVRDTAGPPTP